MVDFAELKAKAAKAKDASVTKMTNTRDRFQSAPSSTMNLDPNHKAPHPSAPRASVSADVSEMGITGPPPQRPSLGGGGSVGGAPPPVRRYMRPDIGSTPISTSSTAHAPSPPPRIAVSPAPRYTPRHTPSAGTDEIDWTNLSPEDKEVFFDWLDEFFSRYLGVTLTPRERSVGSGSYQMTLPPPASGNRLGPPPRVNFGSKPVI